MSTPTAEILFREVNAVQSLLSKEVTDPISTVKYSVFKNTLLPMLLNPESFNRDVWVESVGHQFVRLHVLNDDGSVKYNIPPLHTPLETTKAGANVDIGLEMQAAYAVSPMYAGARLRKLLNDMVPEDTDNSIEVKQVLNQIYEDHGLSPLFKASATEPVAEESKPDTDTLIEDGYDEF